MATRSCCSIEDKFKQITDTLWKRRVSQVWHKMTDSSPGVMIEDGSGNAQIPVHGFWDRHVSCLMMRRMQSGRGGAQHKARSKRLLLPSPQSGMLSFDLTMAQ
jgi:hypothetical protein